MRIVIIEPDGTGGMTHFAFMLARGLSELGARVTLITASDYELSGLPHEFEVRTEFSLWQRVDTSRSEGSEGDSRLARLHRRVIRRAWRALRLTMEMWRVVRMVREQGPEIVLTRPIPVPGRGPMLGRLKRSGISIVEVTHEFEPREAGDGMAARIERALYGSGSQWVDLRLFLGDSVRDDYARHHPWIPRDRLVVVPHGDGELFELLAHAGTDLPGRLGIEAQDRVVLFFGNLRPSKGVEDLLQAFARADRPPGSKLLVVGYPSRDVDVGRLFEMGRDLGIDDSVRFELGYYPNELVGPLFRLARFVVLPYRTATQSGPLHIAITFAKPVLATRTGGIVDVVEDGVTGMLVGPRDVPALSAGLERMLRDDQLIERMGSAMTRARARFDWLVVAGRVLESARSVMPGEPP